MRKWSRTSVSFCNYNLETKKFQNSGRERSTMKTILPHSFPRLSFLFFILCCYCYLTVSSIYLSSAGLNNFINKDWWLFILLDLLRDWLLGFLKRMKVTLVAHIWTPFIGKVSFILNAKWHPVINQHSDSLCHFPKGHRKPISGSFEKFHLEEGPSTNSSAGQFFFLFYIM